MLTLMRHLNPATQRATIVTAACVVLAALLLLLLPILACA